MGINAKCKMLSKWQRYVVYLNIFLNFLKDEIAFSFREESLDYFNFMAR